MLGNVFVRGKNRQLGIGGGNRTDFYVEKRSSGRAAGDRQVRRRPIGMTSHNRHMTATSRIARGTGPGGINPARIMNLPANTATTTPPQTAKINRRKPAKALGRRVAGDPAVSARAIADRFPRENVASIRAVITPPTTGTTSSVKIAP